MVGVRGVDQLGLPVLKALLQLRTLGLQTTRTELHILVANREGGRSVSRGAKRDGGEVRRGVPVPSCVHCWPVLVPPLGH